MQPRLLNSFDATMLVMGGIIGVGIFFNPRAVAESVPHPAWFLGVWCVGGLIAVAGALTFAELGASLPSAGGWYVYLREVFGPFIAFLFAWVVLFVISTGACAVMMSIATANLAGIVPGIGPPGSAGAYVAGCTILVAITALTMLGAKAGATFQNACMVIKLGAIAAMIAGAWLVFDGPSQLSVATPRPAEGLWSGALRAMLPVLFACGGWQFVCYIAPQVRDPQKTLPRAILVGIAGVILVYLAINTAYLRVLGIEGLASDPLFASEMARRTLGSTGAGILRAAMGISALGVCAVTIIATPWLYVAMAREGLFFRRFERLHPTSGAPIAALAVQCALCLAYWTWGSAEILVNSLVFVEWIFHALVAIALLRLRATRPELPRPFVSPFYPLAPIVYLALACAIVLGNLAQANVRDVGIGLFLLALGALLYRPWRAMLLRT